MLQHFYVTIRNQIKSTVHGFLTKTVILSWYMISSWSERMISDTGTETWSRLLREAAVEYFPGFEIRATRNCLSICSAPPWVYYEFRQTLEPTLTGFLLQLVRKREFYDTNRNVENRKQDRYKNN